MSGSTHKGKRSATEQAACSRCKLHHAPQYMLATQHSVAAAAAAVAAAMVSHLRRHFVDSVLSLSFHAAPVQDCKLLNAAALQWE